MIFSSRRRRTGPDPHLEWKVRIFFLGALLALVGMARESSLLVGGAIVVLLVGVLLRFLPAQSEDEEEEWPEGEGQEPQDSPGDDGGEERADPRSGGTEP